MRSAVSTTVSPGGENPMALDNVGRGAYSDRVKAIAGG